MSLPDYSTQAPGVRQVVEIGFEEIVWSYEQGPSVQPRCFFGSGRSYSTKVEPMPAYAHDLEQVTKLLEHCGIVAPLCNPVTISILKLIDSRHVNGWAQQRWHYDNEEVAYTDKDGKSQTRARNWDGIVCLSGRTTEIHPAIARYVVPHEYAHILEDALEILRGPNFIRDWGKARKIPEESWDIAYSPTTHHRMPGEIFANDFRCYVAEQEQEWWPHNDTVPPLGARGTTKGMKWWDTAIEDLNQAYKEAKGTK